MLVYLYKNRLIKDTQHGFLPGRSCSSSLLTFLDYVSSSIDDRDFVDVIYLDLRKAFDSVPHRGCLLYTSPSPRDLSTSRMPSSA